MGTGNKKDLSLGLVLGEAVKEYVEAKMKVLYCAIAFASILSFSLGVIASCIINNYK